MYSVIQDSSCCPPPGFIKPMHPQRAVQRASAGPLMTGPDERVDGPQSAQRHEQPCDWISNSTTVQQLLQGVPGRPRQAASANTAQRRPLHYSWEQRMAGVQQRQQSESPQSRGGEKGAPWSHRLTNPWSLALWLTGLQSLLGPCMQLLWGEQNRCSRQATWNNMSYCVRITGGRSSCTFLAYMQRTESQPHN